MSGMAVVGVGGVDCSFVMEIVVELTAVVVASLLDWVVMGLPPFNPMKYPQPPLGAPPFSPMKYPHPWFSPPLSPLTPPIPPHP